MEQVIDVGAEIDAVTTFDSRETEDKLCYKEQADEYRKELNEAQHNLDNAKKQIEFMVEEKKSLMTTIVNNKKYILETENKATKSAGNAICAYLLYTVTNNHFKDEIHEFDEKYVRILREKDHLQEQLQTLKKIRDAEFQDQRKMIDHLKKKMAEVENENDINAKSAEMFHGRRNYCEQQLNATMMQSEKEQITSQRTITNLQNNIRTLSEELKESKKSVTNSEAEKIVSQRTITKLQTNIRNLYQELNDLKTRFSSVTDKLRGAEQKVIELTKNIDDQTQDKETVSAKLDKLEKENECLVNQLMETEDTLCYKEQADEYRKELNEAQHNLYNAKQQIESMAEEKKSLMTTIVNKNEHILETENKAAKSAGNAICAYLLYTVTNNHFKDEIREFDEKYVRIIREKDHLQEQLQTLKKIKDAEFQDQRKMIDHLKKKMAEVENENDINAKMFHRRRNYCEHKLNTTMMQSEKEKITSQRTITNLQNNIRTLSEELKEYKKRYFSVTDKLQEAEQKVFELTKNIDDKNQDKVTASAKLKKIEKENEYLVNQLRMHAHCSENEIELEKHKNAHFKLLLQLDRVHNNSRISMEETALFDKTFIEQKLEDERAKEENLAEETTNVIKKFASAKDRHGVIKSFQKRIEKSSCPCPFGNDVLSDEDSHMERFPTAIHEHRDNKQYNERLEESKTTKNCHNKTEKNTNVFNISMNIAKSNVSFIDKKEERTLRLNGGSSDHKAIEGKEQL